MRKQCHSWPSETGSGFDAWDVARLILLSRGLRVQEVQFEEIEELDTVHWFDETSRPTVRVVVEHMKLMSELDPTYVGRHIG
ncbi:MAG: hypothetical protein M0Z47_11620 [Actinomycetota bacterium]|nr:hypothetical protein [Actinomycetota bacterium]